MRFSASFHAAVMLPLLASPATAQCRLCAVPATVAVPTPARPLSIVIEANLDFSRAAGTGSGGSIALDGRSGVRRVSGLIDLGGFALAGRAFVTGEPLRRIRVDLPAQITLTTPDGAVAEATDLSTDLVGAPTLDATGSLRFGFGGRLVVRGTASGEFRGRIPITVEYE